MRVIIIGAGHAGVEAAYAVAKMGVEAVLVTIQLENIGQMSCNPSVGGIAKGHLVKEIDMLGGLMGRAADASGIHFKVLNKSVKDEIARLRWQKSISPIIFTILIFTIGRIWILAFHSLANYLGLVSAGIAIALKDPLVNLFAYTYIMGRKPFSVGDRVKIGDMSGDVIDVKLFQFSVMEIGDWVKGDQTTGRIVQVPNGKVFTQNITNFTDGINYIWEDLDILITFESDWKRAKEILNNKIEIDRKWGVSKIILQIVVVV